jgi:tetratricopeptide (TPR) repeat protein
LLQQARLHWQQGNLDATIALCQLIINQNQSGVSNTNTPNTIDTPGATGEIATITNSPDPTQLFSSNDLATVYFLLGNAYKKQGDRPQAAASYAEAIKLNPQHAYAAFNLGIVQSEQGQLEQAIANFQTAAQLLPNNAKVHFKLGTTLLERYQWQAATPCFERVIALEPDFWEAHYNLGICWRKLEQFEAAIACYEKVRQLQPDRADIYFSLGNVFLDLNQLDEAIANLQQCLQLQPDYAAAHSSLGYVFYLRDQFEQALWHYHRAIELDPNLHVAHVNLGEALLETNQLAEAIAAFETALAIVPDHAETHVKYAKALLTSGDLRRGFAEHEWRWRMAYYPMPDFSQPLWRGFEPGIDTGLNNLNNLARLDNPDPTATNVSAPEPDLTGKTILIWSEAGQFFGDTFHFVRYLPLLAARLPQTRIVLQCHSALARLLETIADIDQVITVDRLPGLQFDYHLPLLSLPYIFKTSLNTIPDRIPYLTVPDAARSPQLNEIFTSNKFKIGIVWASGKRPGIWFNRFYRHKSCPLELFGQLLQLPQAQAIELYSLQVGEDAQQLAQFKQINQIDNFMSESGDRSLVAMLPQIQDLSPYIQDFADTAALIEQLDLVIAVDTAVAHLAGALAKPVWLLLAFDAEWRWLRDRRDCPWYPTMRLFRQPQLGDWQSVFQALAAALTEELISDPFDYP